MVDAIVIGVSTGVDLLHGQLPELDVRPDLSQECGESFVIERQSRGQAGRGERRCVCAVTDIAAGAATMRER